MSWFREDGELYLAVKVVDQEVNRLDRVRWFYPFLIFYLYQQTSECFLAMLHVYMCR